MLREPAAAAFLIAQRRVFHGAVYLQPSKALLDMSPSTRQELYYDDPLTLPLATVEPYASLGYRVIEGSFMMLSGANMPAASFDVQLAPSSRADDESIDLVLMRGDVSRLQLISTFLNLESGSHMKSDYIYAYKVTSFSLIPSSGIVDISGELYPNPNVENEQGEHTATATCSTEKLRKDVTVNVHPKAISFIF